MFKRLLEKIKSFFKSLARKIEERENERKIHRARNAQKVKINPLSEAEIHGVIGERAATSEILALLPDARIKNNVIISSARGNAEIDCMLLYRGSLFAIEIKSWKGDIYEREDGFLQCKRDRYTGEIHQKLHRSPLRQVKRAISLLKENTTQRVWINGAVFIEEADYLEVSDDSPVFNDVEKLVDYIEAESRDERCEVTRFFDELRPADRIIGAGILGARHLYANVILDFVTQGATYLDVEHLYTSDIVTVHYENGTSKRYEFENKKIKAITTNGMVELTLSGIDKIIFGKEKN